MQKLYRKCYENDLKQFFVLNNTDESDEHSSYLSFIKSILVKKTTFQAPFLGGSAILGIVHYTK